MVSVSRGCERKSMVFTGAWFLMVVMLVFVSYSFVIQPENEAQGNGIASGAESAEGGAGGVYSVKCTEDGTYYVYFREQVVGEVVGEVVWRDSDAR